jgi:hypothetical protein
VAFEERANFGFEGRVPGTRVREKRVELRARDSQRGFEDLSDALPARARVPSIAHPRVQFIRAIDR